jgi:hypothetical protein
MCLCLQKLALGGKESNNKKLHRTKITLKAPCIWKERKLRRQLSRRAFVQTAIEKPRALSIFPKFRQQHAPDKKAYQAVKNTARTNAALQISTKQTAAAHLKRPQ